MADKEWQGVDGDWATAGNWSGGTVPVDGDSIFFTGTSQQSITSGLTLGASGDTFADFHVHEDYTGAIGSSGSKLTLASTGITGKLQIDGGKVFIDTPAAAKIVIGAAGGVDFFEIDGGGGTAFPEVYLEGASGSGSFTNGAAIENLDMHACPNLTLTIGTGVTSMNRLRADSGRVINSSAVTSGTTPLVLLSGTARLEQLVGALTDLWIAGRSICDHQSSGNITNLRVWDTGTFDGRNNTTVGTVTITNLYRHIGSKVFTDNGLGTYAITNKTGGGDLFEPV